MSARKVSTKYGMSQQALYTRVSHKGQRARAEPVYAYYEQRR